MKAKGSKAQGTQLGKRSARYQRNHNPYEHADDQVKRVTGLMLTGVLDEQLALMPGRHRCREAFPKPAQQKLLFDDHMTGRAPI